MRADPIRRATAIAACLVGLIGNAASTSDIFYEATGRASWYGDELRNRKTASGERFDPDGLTAAHRTLPFNCYVEVLALDSGRAIIVRVNDRGPYHGNRLIDLSHGAARQLGMVGNGARLVRVRRVNLNDAQKHAVRRGQSLDTLQTITGTDLDRLRDRNSWSAPTSMRTTVPAGGGPYFIRIATFSSKSRAISMAVRLTANVVEAGGLYQVRLGPYENMTKINAALAPLSAKGYSDVRIVR